MRILLISFFFPPYNSIGAVRLGKTAKYLIRFGHEVRVLSARDQSVPSASLSLEIPPEHVTYTRWFNLRRPLDRLVGGAGRGLSWSDTAAPVATSGVRRAGQAILGTLRALLYFPDLQAGWLPFATAAGARLLETWRPDVLYASAYPVTGLIVAHRLARRFGIPWVGELRDLWVGNHNFRHPAWRTRLEAGIERRVMASAAGLVTVSEPLAERLRARFGKPTTVVLNGFDPDDYPSRPEAPRAAGGLRLVHTGTIYPRWQSPSPLFEALRQMGRLADGVRVAFFGPQPGLVRELAARHGVTRQVEVRDLVSYREALAAQSSADVLLFLSWNDPQERGVYSGKLFEYIGARRPILAVGNAENVADELICERGVGVRLSDPVQIASRLEAWIREKQEKGNIPPLPASVGAGLSREEQARVLEAYLLSLLAGEGSKRDETHA